MLFKVLTAGLAAGVGILIAGMGNIYSGVGESNRDALVVPCKVVQGHRSK